MIFPSPLSDISLSHKFTDLNHKIPSTKERVSRDESSSSSSSSSSLDGVAHHSPFCYVSLFLNSSHRRCRWSPIKSSNHPHVIETNGTRREMNQAELNHRLFCHSLFAFSLLILISLYLCPLPLITLSQFINDSNNFPRGATTRLDSSSKWFMNSPSETRQFFWWYHKRWLSPTGKELWSSDDEGCQSEVDRCSR